MPRAERRQNRGGFTLLELMVALALSAGVLLGARAMLEALADDADRISTAAAQTDADANAEQTLRGLIGQIEVGPSDSAEFAGSPDAARFTTWCDMPGGWQERCRVVLAVEVQRGVVVLAAHREDGSTVVLRRGARTGAFRYLSSAANGGQWLPRWGAGTTAPLAIGILFDDDTLVARIGERG